MLKKLLINNSIINRYTCLPEDLNKMIITLKSKNLIPIIDYANEDNRYPMKNYYKICTTINKNPNNTFAFKFSSLDILNSKTAFDLTNNIVRKIINNNSIIMIDAEDVKIQDKINNMTDLLINKYNKDKPIIYKTYQMYRKDSFDTLKKDLEIFKDSYLGIKLVRGAYYNQDKKSNLLYLNKQDTDNDYNNAIKYFDKSDNKKHHLVVASHNKTSLDLVKQCSHPNISIAHLLGFSDDISQEFSNDNYKVYKYLPFGNYNDTLPYLIRRLYENYPLLMYISK